MFSASRGTSGLKFCRYGRPITMESYIEQFCSETEGAPRAAVKRLTRAIESALVETTINGPDWDTLYVARMALDIMWDNKKFINLDEFVTISQTCVVCVPDCRDLMAF